MTGLAFLIATAIWSIQSEHYWFWDSSKWHDPYPNDGTVPFGISRLYHFEIGYYLFSLVSLYFEPKMKDFWVMVTHHLFTLTLLISSYIYGATKYGTVIMLLHDIADPLMEAAKLSLYLGFQDLANYIFIAFAVVFIALRDVVYPLYVILPTRKLLIAHQYEFYTVTMSCLVALWFMHLFWTSLIIQIAVKAVQSGNAEGDIRDTDDD